MCGMCGEFRLDGREASSFPLCPGPLTICQGICKLAAGSRLIVERGDWRFAESLPSRFKVRRGQRKWLHKQAARHYVPPDVLRRPKRGFAGNIIRGWLREARVGEMVSVLRRRDAGVYRYLDHETVNDVLERHRTQREDNYEFLFSVVMLEKWIGWIESRTRGAD